MNLNSRQLHEALLTEVRRRLFEENFRRLEQCLDLLSETEIWQRPNAISNSVGNLVLHLCGNCRQWILSGIGHAPDTRTRQQEFDEEGPVPTAHLLHMLHELREELNRTLHRVTPDMLVETHRVQGFEESGTAILVHVVEHFSYHVGQVTYITKSLGKDPDYYAGKNLDAKG